MRRAPWPGDPRVNVQNHNGKFLVRMPPETHRALVLREAEEGVSLNRLVRAPS